MGLFWLKLTYNFCNLSKIANRHLSKHRVYWGKDIPWQRTSSGPALDQHWRPASPEVFCPEVSSAVPALAQCRYGHWTRAGHQRLSSAGHQRLSRAGPEPFCRRPEEKQGWSRTGPELYAGVQRQTRGFPGLVQRQSRGIPGLVQRQSRVNPRLVQRGIAGVQRRTRAYPRLPYSPQLSSETHEIARTQSPSLKNYALESRQSERPAKSTFRWWKVNSASPIITRTIAIVVKYVDLYNVQSSIYIIKKIYTFLVMKCCMCGWIFFFWPPYYLQTSKS